MGLGVFSRVGTAGGHPTLFWIDAAGPRRVTFVCESTPRGQFSSWELRVNEFDGTAPHRDGNYATQFHFDFGPSGDLGWCRGTDQGKGEFLSSAALVDKFAKRLLGVGRPRRPFFAVLGRP
jgi:hypothetical protein